MVGARELGTPAGRRCGVSGGRPRPFACRGRLRLPVWALDSGPLNRAGSGSRTGAARSLGAGRAAGSAVTRAIAFSAALKEQGNGTFEETFSHPAVR